MLAFVEARLEHRPANIVRLPGHNLGNGLTKLGIADLRFARSACKAVSFKSSSR